MRPALLGPLLALSLASACVTPPASNEPTTPTADAPPAEGTLAAPARPLSGLYRPGEVRAFEFVQEGVVIGRSYGRYEGTTEHQGQQLHRVVTRVELLPPNSKPLRWVSELLFDNQGRLVEGVERSVAAELTFRARTNPDALLIEARSGLPKVQSEELTYDGDDAVMGYMATIHEELMLATRGLAVGANDWRLISLSAGRADPWSAEVRVEGETVVLSTSLGEEIWLEDGRITRVEVPEDKLVVQPIAHAQWPEWDVEGPQGLSYAPAADASFTIREVELPGVQGEAALQGEVLVPKAAVHGKGPYPAVVFLGGSVSADRYGFAGPPAIDMGYHEITDALANAGFVVIRYDEPGTGTSEATTPSWASQREDARRAFRTLLIQPEVDPERVLAIGHAEGGWRALALASERPKEVVGVALLATPGRSYRELFAKQPDVLKALESGKGLPESLKPMAQWYGEILVEDPDAMIFKAKVPIWIAQGGKDFEVDPVKDTAALTASARKYKREHELVKFPKLDHLFKQEPGESTHASYLEPRPVDREFLNALVEWAKRVGKGKAKPR